MGFKWKAGDPNTANLFKCKFCASGRDPSYFFVCQVKTPPYMLKYLDWLPDCCGKSFLEM